ncbi:class I SAM-dependent methyltransferase [Microvirga puerhi]|uniref:Methyltransferase domain-containing protein n=1 Tax=Microvirga puerhi TaxID=2876078 RepID=A0ABS7VJL3_9HYPH|nr:class I SAM-dependent methyltransferase [Microvirga puerhi]MBZ6075158.1 methyltransferase domain-containing protein [Microvirga puerhi]
MNAQVGNRVAVHQPLLSTQEEQRLSVIMETVERNRFLPAPTPENVFVGDGDYRAIGAEYLGHFVRLGGLKPSHRVLDVGCGIGRMAVPLTQYLDGEASRYEGVDPVKDGIEWCVQNITSVYPHFRFCQIDLAHELYNPGGALGGHEVVLPFSDASFDFIAMVSVATHLPIAEIAAYSREIRRLLSPVGRLFMTTFLVLDGDLERENARPKFVPGKDPGTWYGAPDAPLAAIGFDRNLVEQAVREAGLQIECVSLGHWRGIDSMHYQDVVIATSPGKAA